MAYETYEYSNGQKSTSTKFSTKKENDCIIEFCLEFMSFRQVGYFAMSFDPSHLLSQLTALKREDGDIRLTCDGIVIKAHSYILSLRLGPMIISL